MNDRVVYALRDDIVTRVIDDELVIYDPVSDLTALLNISAAVAVDLCDGTRSLDEIVAEVRELFGDLPDGIDGIFLPRDSMINSAIAVIAKAAISRKIPLSGPGYNQVTRGALFGYGVRQGDVGRTAARLANEVLSGTDPAIVPVESVDSHLYLNTETARAIGLSLSPALLSQARVLLP